MSCKLRVTFVLPRTGEWPSGGLRVVYEYANRLADRNHVVTVAHPARLVIDPNKFDHLKNAARYILRKLDGRYTPNEWLSIDPRVRLLCLPSLSDRFLPDGDIVIATAWQTAEWVSRYPRSKGRGVYFIQHFETWNGPKYRVVNTWKTPLQKIVPSRWLAEMARDLGETAIYIPNGLDIESFSTVIPSEKRRSNQLMMLYHEAEWKGSADGLDAIFRVREKNPDLRLTLFGVPERPPLLPEWVEYYRSPSPKLLRDLYNQTAIFVAPSRTEGWGLPGCEALLCGAALVATDIDGHREFAVHERTALTSPARSPEALADNILRLIQSPELRIELAKSGSQYVRQFTWERALNSFEAALFSLA